MIRAQKHTRRLFLQGLGGTVVAGPLLASLGGRPAQGQSLASQGPRRFIAMFTHHGCITTQWFPMHSHGALTASALSGTTLEALTPYVDKLLMPRGIRAMNEWTPDLSLGQGNDTHLQVCGSYFTCVPVTPHSDDPFSFDTSKRFNALPTAPSLDHVCAQQLNPSGEPLYYRVSGSSESPMTCVSFSAGETMYRGIGNLAEAFNELTNLFEEDTVDVSYEAARRNSVVDLVKDDLATLERHDLGAADRAKLDAWKELLHETSGVVLTAQCSRELDSFAGELEEHLDEDEGGTVGDRLATPLIGELDQGDVFANIAVLNALCDANRVIVLKYPDNYVFSALGLEIETHSMANRTGNAGLGGQCIADANAMILTMDRYYAAKFAHVVKQLDSVEEGEGTLLDNTAAVWFHQMSDGGAANLNNMPLLQAGSCSGYFKTGEIINVEDGSADLHPGNSEEACDVHGVIDDIKDMGTPREFGNAPINKYFCGLMNAIGVKAGADGFPAPGGTQEVTHYGMYDDTRDFASGGDNPPKINDPGEFEALRA